MKYTYVFLLSFIQLITLSQNETRYWYFGKYAGLDFSTSPPAILANSSMTTNEGCATLSDAAGNLLLYTDGSTIYDKTHGIMTNGTGLTGNTSTSQSGLIVKQAGNSNICFVFSLGSQGSGTLAYSTVDLSLSSGNGAVTIKNTFLAAPMSENLTAVKHCNGIDTWVIAHDNSSDKFRCYLVTAAGVSATPVTTNIGPMYTGVSINWLGNLKASPNGKKLGVSHNGSTGGFEVYDFDNATGVISNSLNLGTFEDAYGCEFSPDGSKFYGDHVPSSGPSKLYQWNLCAGSPTAIVASQYSMAVSLPLGIYGMQLAKDGKIYIANYMQTSLGVINSPDASGAACNYVQVGQSTAPKTCYLNLPNFMTSHLKPAPQPFTHTVSCGNASFNSPAITNTANAGCGAIVTTPTNVLWSFGDPSSGAANSSTLTSPSHIYTSAGTYSVQLVLYGPCTSDTLRQTVAVVNISPSLSVTGSFTMCAGEKRTFTVSGASSYTWNSGQHTSTLSLSPAQTTSYNVTGTGTNSCPGSQQFTVTVNKCTSIEEADPAGSFAIYPNPAQDHLTIETEKPVHIVIRNSMGQVILDSHLEAGHHELDTRNYSSGIYSIKVISNKESSTLKLVKTD